MCKCFTKVTGPSLSFVIPKPLTDGANVFCDMSHKFHKQPPAISKKVFAIHLWGFLTSSLNISMFSHTMEGTENDAFTLNVKVAV